MSRAFSFSSMLAASIVGAASVILSAPSQAEAASFTDFNLWSAAAREVLPETSPEDFTGVSIGDQDVIDFSSFSNLPIISTASSLNPLDNASRRHQVSVGRNNNNSRFRVTLNNQNPNIYDLVTWTFTRNDVFGFFANLRNIDDGLTLTATNSNGSVETIDLVSAVGGAPNAMNISGDFGILSDTAYDSIMFSFNGAGNGAFAIDDLSVAVPSPALLPGFVGMGVAALRKRSKAGDVEEA